MLLTLTPLQVTSAAGVIVHFSHEEFPTCRVMDKHLRILAARCPGAKFLSINAAKAPFFTNKLRVKVLPTIVFFIDGIAVGRQTGFEGLVGPADDSGVSASFGSHRVGLSAELVADDFPTARLMRVLRISGVLGPAARAAAIEEGDDGCGDDDDEEGGGGAFGGMIMMGGGGGSKDGAGWALKGGVGGGAASTAALHAARAARDAKYYDIGE